MRRASLLVLGLLVTLGCAPAQVLINTTPESAMIYAGARGGLKELGRLTGDGAIWNSPFSLDDRVMKRLDQGMELMARRFGITTGSPSAWLRSIRGWELVLYDLNVEEGFFEMDFALVVETPDAEQIYDVMSGALLKRAIAERGEEGAIEVPLDDFSLNIHRQGDHLLVTGNASRLRELQGKLGQRVAQPGSVAKSPLYLAAVGEAGQGLGPGEEVRLVAWFGVGALVELGLKTGAFNGPPGPPGPMGRRRRRGPPRQGNSEIARRIFEQFGLTHLRGACYVETSKRSAVRVEAKEDVLPFQLMEASGGSELLGAFPATSLFAFAWPGRMQELWEIYRDRVVLNPDLPFAVFLQEQVRVFQKRSGLEVAEIAALCDGGVGFAVVPLEDGRVRPGSFCMVARTTDPARAADVAKGLIELARRTQDEEGREIEEQRPGELWIYPEGRRPNPARTTAILVRGNTIIAGSEASVRATARSSAGEGPSLESKGVRRAFADGKPHTGFWYLGYETMLGQNDGTSGALGNLRPGLGLLGVLDVTPRSLQMSTVRPISEIFSLMAISAARQDGLRRQRRKSAENLRKIQEAYMAYLGENEKHPRSLAQLGFVGENRLVCPLDVGRATGKPSYYLVPGPITEDEGRREIRAYARNVAYGRLVLDRSGKVRTWSENEFQAKLRATKRD